MNKEVMYLLNAFTVTTVLKMALLLFYLNIAHLLHELAALPGQGTGFALNGACNYMINSNLSFVIRCYDSSWKNCILKTPNMETSDSTMHENKQKTGVQ